MRRPRRSGEPRLAFVRIDQVNKRERNVLGVVGKHGRRDSTGFFGRLGL